MKEREPVTRRVLAAAGLAAAIAAVAPGVARAATRNVFVGGDGVVQNAPKQFSPNAFLRNSITVHVGDTVRWRFRGFHTVTVPARGKEPPPFVLPTSTLVSGALDAAGQPFWFNGQLPVLAPNPRAAAPTKGTTYDGRSLRNSGLPQGQNPKPYRLRFTRAGSFDYYCAVHPGMEGHVRVVSARRRVPTEAQNRAAATAELNRLAAQARTVAAAPAPAAGTVDLGRAPRGRRFTINAFFPSAITVKTGQSVQFTMAGQNPNEIHTVTLGPQTRAQLPFVTNTGTINPIAAYPSDPPTAFPPYTGVNHGNGFLNVGLRDNDAATALIPPSGAVQFNAVGTFQLKCLVHEGMDATVTVTP
jgi:plastocyanin